MLKIGMTFLANVNQVQIIHLHTRIYHDEGRKPLRAD